MTDELDGRIGHITLPVNERNAAFIEYASKDIPYENSILLAEHRQANKYFQTEKPSATCSDDTQRVRIKRKLSFRS
jgi:hypothetical protein